MHACMCVPKRVTVLILFELGALTNPVHAFVPNPGSCRVLSSTWCMWQALAPLQCL